MTSGCITRIDHRVVAAVQHIHKCPTTTHSVLQPDSIDDGIRHKRAARPSDADIALAACVDPQRGRTQITTTGILVAGVDERHTCCALAVDATLAGY